MSRILLATFGSLGDLHPYIAVGKALRSLGHAACIASPPDYRDAVEKEGLEFATVRPGLADLGPQEELAAKLFHPWRGTEYLLRRVVMPYVHQAYDDVSRAAQGADLLVSHPITYTVRMVAERQGKPWLSSLLAPMSLTSRFDPPALPGPDLLRRAAGMGSLAYRLMLGLVHEAVYRWEAPLRELRSELGFPDTKVVMTMEGQHSPRGVLAMFDAPLMQPQPDWPVNTTVCGAALYDGESASAAALAELHDFLGAGEPPLVFALGSSAIWIAGKFWQHAMEATQRLGRRAILLTGKADLPQLPEDIRAFQYLPYSQVFPHAAAIVHQAGIGTLSQALRAGRPQVITPVAFDQPDNAMRAGRLGVARVLPFRKVSASGLYRELEAVLADAEMERASARIAAMLQNTNGAMLAAQQIIAAIR